MEFEEILELFKSREFTIDIDDLQFDEHGEEFDCIDTNNAQFIRLICCYREYQRFLPIVIMKNTKQLRDGFHRVALCKFMDYGLSLHAVYYEELTDQEKEILGID